MTNEQRIKNIEIDIALQTEAISGTLREVNELKLLRNVLVTYKQLTLSEFNDLDLQDKRYYIKATLKLQELEGIGWSGVENNFSNMKVLAAFAHLGIGGTYFWTLIPYKGSMVIYYYDKRTEKFTPIYDRAVCNYAPVPYEFLAGGIGTTTIIRMLIDIEQGKHIDLSKYIANYHLN